MCTFAVLVNLETGGLLILKRPVVTGCGASSGVIGKILVICYWVAAGL